MSFFNGLIQAICFFCALTMTFLTFYVMVPVSFWDTILWFIIPCIIAVLAGWVFIFGILAK
jgi:hypothetical protein